VRFRPAIPAFAVALCLVMVAGSAHAAPVFTEDQYQQLISFVLSRFWGNAKLQDGTIVQPSRVTRIAGPCQSRIRKRRASSISASRPASPSGVDSTTCRTTPSLCAWSDNVARGPTSKSHSSVSSSVSPKGL
jgi:hypothetical protein